MATLTLKDGFGIIINELRQVCIPAEQALANGVHVGRAYQIASEIFAAIEKDEQATADQARQDGDGHDAPVLELVPDEDVSESDGVDGPQETN